MTPEQRAARIRLVALDVDGVRRQVAVARAGSASLDGAPRWQVLVDGVALWLDDLSLLPQRQGGAAGAADQLRAPFNGKVVALHVAPGDVVEQGAPVLVLESMKLEHSLAAPRSGVVTRVPPLSDLALPTEETTTSMVWPGWAKAGSCAVTSTAATFLGCRLAPGGRVMPRSWRRCSIDMVQRRRFSGEIQRRRAGDGLATGAPL